MCKNEKIEIEQYHQLIQTTCSHIKHLFIATDDYRVIDNFIHITDNHYTIQTKCPKSHTGYYQKDFDRLKPIQRKSKMTNLLIDLHLLINSDFFIGPYSSNVGRLISLCKGQEKCFAVDNLPWHPF